MPAEMKSIDHNSNLHQDNQMQEPIESSVDRNDQYQRADEFDESVYFTKLLKYLTGNNESLTFGCDYLNEVFNLELANTVEKYLMLDPPNDDNISTEIKMESLDLFSNDAPANLDLYADCMTSEDINGAMELDFYSYGDKQNIIAAEAVIFPDQNDLQERVYEVDKNELTERRLSSRRKRKINYANYNEDDNKQSASSDSNFCNKRSRVFSKKLASIENTIEKQPTDSKKRRYISFEMKKNIVQLAQDHPDWNMKKLLEYSGCAHTYAKLDTTKLRKWNFQINHGGSRSDKIQCVNQWVYNKYIEFKQNGKKKKISDETLMEWVSEAKEELFTSNGFTFKAAPGWINRFKNLYRINIEPSTAKKKLSKRKKKKNAEMSKEIDLFKSSNDENDDASSDSSGYMVDEAAGINEIIDDNHSMENRVSESLILCSRNFSQAENLKKMIKPCRVLLERLILP